jgi:hypothetical protein
MSHAIIRWILQTSWQAGGLAVLIWLAQRLMARRLSPAWRYGLWFLLIARLLMPSVPQTAFSVFNLVGPKAESTVVNPSATAPASGGNEAVGPIRGNMGQIGGQNELQSFPPTVATDWFSVAFWGWLSGICFLGARLAWSNGRFLKRISRCKPI